MQLNSEGCQWNGQLKVFKTQIESYWGQNRINFCRYYVCKKYKISVTVGDRDLTCLSAQKAASQSRYLANRNAGLAVPPLFWPVNFINIGGHVALIDLNNTGSRIHNKILKSSPPSWYSRSSVLCGCKSNLLNKEVFLSIENADCPPSWYSKFVISAGFTWCHCMRDPVLFISMVALLSGLTVYSLYCDSQTSP